MVAEDFLTLNQKVDYAGGRPPSLAVFTIHGTENRVRPQLTSEKHSENLI